MSNEPFHKRLHRVQDLIPYCCYRVDWGMGSLDRFIEQYGVDMDPDYQRDYVWTIEQKQLFVGAVIQNHNSIPIFWFNFGLEGINAKESEVVDGKQRMNALLGWQNNEYEALCPCGETFWHKDVDEIGNRGLNTSIVLKMHFVRLSRLDVLKYYLTLNSGGTIHSPKELDKVRKMIKELESKNGD